MDGGSATNLLPRNKASLIVNGTVRTGYLNNRPGWMGLPLSFPDDETRTNYTTGKFQGSGVYQPDIGLPFFFVSVSGRIYKIVLGTTFATCEDITPSGDPNMSTLPRVWMCQADTFMVIQDGLDAPFIYDGNTLRRSTCILPDNPNNTTGEPWLDPSNKEVPTGTAMCYGYGRLWLVRGKSVAAGDILNAAIPNSAILFTEVLQFKDEFAVPLTSGDITAIIFGANIDTSLGQGALQLHTSSGQVTTVNVGVDRTTWTTTSIQEIGLVGGAATGQDAVVNVNNDTWFRAHDGLRSFVVARRQFNTWGNTPESREVSNILNDDQPDLLAYASGVWFNNRLLMTCSPQVTQGHRFFSGLVSLDFDLLSTLNRYSGTAYDSDPQPCYDGIWTGLNISQIIKTFFGTTERCFIFSWDAVLGNQMWELLPDGPQSAFDNGSCPIQSWMETGSYNFNMLTNLKKLVGCDIWIDQLQGEVTFAVYYASEQNPFWTLWQAPFTESDGKPCGTITKVGSQLCQQPINSPPQWRSRIRLQEPETPADGLETDYPTNTGYDFRIRLQWTGRCRLKGIRAFSEVIPEETTGVAP